MVLPTAPPASMSVSQIKTEISTATGAPAPVVATVTNNINTLYGFYGYSSDISTYLGSSFSGKSFTGAYIKPPYFTTIKGSVSDIGYSIAVDTSGNIYITGEYNSSTTVPINTFTTNPTASPYSLPITTGTDVFVIKWTSAGAVSAFTTIKGSGTDIGYSIAVDASGNIYITGQYSSTTAVPINTFTLSPTASVYSLPITTGTDAFAIKWTSAGAVSAFTNIKGSITDIGNSIAVDASGNIYITGQYNSSTAFPINTFATNSTATPYNLPITTGTDIFVIRWTSIGAVSAFTTIKGSGTDIGNSIAVDASGNIYITGQYNSSTTVPINTFTLSPTASVYSLPNTTGTGNDVFVIKWTSAGAVSAFTNIKGAVTDSGNGITVDSGGNIYVTGLYGTSTVVPVVPINTFTANPTASAFNLPSTSLTDVFVIKWTSAGAVSAFTSIKGSGSTDSGYGIVADSGGNIYVTGSYSSTAAVPINTFSTAPVYTGVSLPNASNDAFVIKWNSTSSSVPFVLVPPLPIAPSDTATSALPPTPVSPTVQTFTTPNPASPYTTTYTWLPGTPGKATTSAIIVVGGGGSGGSYGGGGGGGGVAYNTSFTLNSNTPYPITVGAGGVNGNGGPSAFDTLTATGGGAGGGLNPVKDMEGKPGGSGGGGGYGYKGGTGTPGQGRNGGSGGKNFITGGGGGAGFVGLPGTVTTFPVSGQTVPIGGAGGPGLLFPYTGLTYGGGGSGGGNAQTSDYTPTPAPGGGGIGGGSNYNATPGTNGLGGGGGGSGTGTNQNLTTGGSGTVIFTFPIDTTYTFTTPNPATPYTTTWTSTVTGNVSLLVVGGGGGGNAGGGGGGGVLIIPAVPVTIGTIYTIVVGRSGPANFLPSGNPSTFSSPTATLYTAIGGGLANGGPGGAGLPGGSGGGGGPTGGAGTPGQGFPGGGSVGSAGSGGGGASAAGTAGGMDIVTSQTVAGRGGNGILCPFTGLIYGGGGGGGGSYGSPVYGIGGTGGGGVGYSNNGPRTSLPTSGTNGLGGGGGGGYIGPTPTGTFSITGSPGGSGTVVIRVNPATL